MGGEKTTTQNSTSVTMSPEERASLALDTQRKQAALPMQMQSDQQQYALTNKLLQGQDLPGNLYGAQGISDSQNQSMVNSSVRSVLPQFQSAGILDSGIAAQGAIRAAQDTSNQNAQFNVSAFQNLLNQALGGSSNLTTSYNQANQTMSNQLAGLRSVNSSGSTIGMNPFLKSLETSAGSSLGNAAGQGISGGFGKMMGCWVASEIFGGWYHPKTVMARLYINYIAPNWFKEFYIRYGKKFSEFISNKPMIKIILRPLFEMFVLIAERQVYYGR